MDACGIPALSTPTPCHASRSMALSSAQAAATMASTRPLMLALDKCRCHVVDAGQHPVQESAQALAMLANRM